MVVSTLSQEQCGRRENHLMLYIPEHMNLEQDMSMVRHISGSINVTFSMPCLRKFVFSSISCLNLLWEEMISAPLMVVFSLSQVDLAESIVYLIAVRLC